MNAIISTAIPMLGAVGTLFFGLLFLNPTKPKSIHPRPAMIGSQLSLVLLMTGALFDGRMETWEAGIFKPFYLVALLITLFTVGWSYRRLYRQAVPDLIPEDMGESAAQTIGNRVKGKPDGESADR